MKEVYIYVICVFCSLKDGIFIMEKCFFEKLFNMVWYEIINRVYFI